MLYLNKFLAVIKENPLIFKSPDIIQKLGITSTQIKDLKKHALENQLILQEKQKTILTSKGENFLAENPLEKWCSKEFSLRPEIIVEYLKEDKAPAVLTRAMRLLAKHYIDKEPLKDNSLEKALYNDINNATKLYEKIKSDLLSEKRVSIEKIFDKYLSKGITKSLIALVILKVMVENIDKLAIYEKAHFQLNFDSLMFDRIFVCPQNFEIQKTEMVDEYILKDISKIILNKKSNNILEITKGLYKMIKSLDKYVMNTQNLSKKTLRLRNVIINAKDPITLFERDIPKALGKKDLQDCDRVFLNDLKFSLNELKEAIAKLVLDLESFIFESFKSNSKEELAERFLKVKDFIGDKELKVLLNCVIETDVSDDLWVNRLATFINKSRVPKDWSDEDYADFKVKSKELSLKFAILEATAGVDEKFISKKYHSVLNSFLNLSKPEQMILLRKVING